MSNNILFSNAEREIEKELGDIYFKALEKVKNTEEYKKYETQVNGIKDALYRFPVIPEEIINSLVEAVQEQVAMEYEYASKRVISYINNKTFQ